MIGPASPTNCPADRFPASKRPQTIHKADTAPECPQGSTDSGRIAQPPVYTTGRNEPRYASDCALVDIPNPPICYGEAGDRDGAYPMVLARVSNARLSRGNQIHDRDRHPRPSPPDVAVEAHGVSGSPVTLPQSIHHVFQRLAMARTWRRDRHATPIDPPRLPAGS